MTIAHNLFFEVAVNAGLDCTIQSGKAVLVNPKLIFRESR